jgi:peroxiredoxin
MPSVSLPGGLLGLALAAAGIFTADIAGAANTDIEGHAVSLDGKVAAVVFLSPDCPISRSEVATLNKIAADAGGASVLGVISDPTVTRDAAAKFAKDFGVKFPLLFDASGDLATRFKPDHTPEAYVINKSGAVRYSGRIDDAFASVGKQREVVTTHDLRDALAAVAAGKEPAQATTPSVGCVFESWKDSGPLPAKVTYSRDIAPILNANCVTCHRPGEVAPFSLLDYSHARKHAEQIAELTQSRYMPPWKAEEGFGHFADERRLTDREIDLIQRWAANDAPEGDKADLPPPPVFSSDWALGKPDKVAMMPEPFDVPASGPDVYRAFVIPLDLPDDTYVAGVDFRPGAKSVLHHALFYLDGSGKARELDAADPGPGYTSFGGPGFAPVGGLGGWAPGASPSLMADGTARYVPGNSDLVIQVHYHPDGKPHKDQSSLAIYFAKKPVKHLISSLALITRQINIAPGDTNYQRNLFVELPIDVTLEGIIPHMHLIGREMKVQATTPDGKLIPLIHITDWNFKWQDQYRYAEPVHLPKGTRIDMMARYDNSTNNPANPNSPPKRVHWGEGTTDEMCICFLQPATDDLAQARQLRRNIGAQLVAHALKSRAQANKED